MQEVLLTGVRQEVLRLIEQQQSYLELLLGEEAILRGQSLSRETVCRWYEALADEVGKVGRFEMTLAVVGTMKAGKSTTINAIVGAEVLPNRNQPMTTLPTLIRHMQGQTVPRLRFPRPEPFTEAIVGLKAAFQAMQKTGALERWVRGAADDERQLIDQILTDRLTRLATEYTGAAEIFLFLRSVNDISRLCAREEVHLPSPMSQYTQIEQFPVIEVEFWHLRNRQDLAGRGGFVLVDTPGPNEAGQRHLKDVVRGQLEKASAVLSILDYTQINGEAEFEIRQTLLEIARRQREGLFVLVNKFDQQDANSPGYGATRRHVATILFQELIPEERVFPVSSRYAYLANRAQRELELAGGLPDWKTHRWVEAAVSSPSEPTVHSTTATNTRALLYISPLEADIRRIANGEQTALALIEQATKHQHPKFPVPAPGTVKGRAKSQASQPVAPLDLSVIAFSMVCFATVNFWSSAVLASCAIALSSLGMGLPVVGSIPVKSASFLRPCIV